MKNYDSVRNMVEMCLHAAVMGLLTAVELKQNLRLCLEGGLLQLYRRSGGHCYINETK